MLEPMKEDHMLRLVLSLRIVILVASLGAAFGAVLMFWEGGLKLFAAASAIATEHDAKAVIAPIMTATDMLFFGIVLVIFAYSIAFGFAIDVTAEMRNNLAPWMRVEGIDELKQTLIGVILVFLIVDFATDWAQNETEQSWPMLIKPISILFIAGALYLLTHAREGSDRL